MLPLGPLFLLIPLFPSDPCFQRISSYPVFTLFFHLSICEALLSLRFLRRTECTDLCGTFVVLHQSHKLPRQTFTILRDERWHLLKMAAMA